MSAAEAIGVCLLVAVSTEVVRALAGRAAMDRAFKAARWCHACNGRGSVRVMMRGSTGADEENIECPRCSGTGKRDPSVPPGSVAK